MCEVDEDYGEPSPEGLQPSRPGREQKCVKCKEGLPVVVIRAGDAFCRDCFKAFYTHKFRAVLGKNRLIFPGEKVLLAWSGGPSSSSMVWQVLEGLSRDSAKRLRFVPGVIYVDGTCGHASSWALALQAGPKAVVGASLEMARALCRHHCCCLSLTSRVGQEPLPQGPGHRGRRASSLPEGTSPLGPGPGPLARTGDAPATLKTPPWDMGQCPVVSAESAACQGAMTLALPTACGPCLSRDSPFCLWLRGSSLWPERRGQSENPGRGEAGPACPRLPVARCCLGRGVRPSAVGAASLCLGAGGDRGGLQGGRGPLPAAAVCPRGREGGAAEPSLPQGPRAPSCTSHGNPDRGFVQTLRLGEDADGQGGASADAADPLDAPCGPDPRLLQSDDGRQLHTPGRQAPDQPGAGERGLPRLGHGRDAGCPGPGPSCLAPCPRTASGASVSGWPVRNAAHFPQGFSDERHGDVVVVRPMREHTLKEVAFYNRLFAVPSVFTPAIDTKAPEKASVHRLMEAFLLRLQARFPSTVSTVYRTSEKLLKAPRDGFAAGPPGPRCLLCMCALDVDTADSATAFGAQTTSHVSPTQPPVPEAGAADGPCCCAQMGGAQGCCREAARACVIEQLCYGCRVNLKDMPSLDPLPPYILAEAQLRSQRPSAEQEAWASLLGSDEEAQVGES
uniref:Cytoplasmic tRNA 2-thiolation protein 2 n=1 Tax=Sus scrofa TaxID=9823 RepID=A0A8D0ZJU0_PIG